MVCKLATFRLLHATVERSHARTHALSSQPDSRSWRLVLVKVFDVGLSGGPVVKDLYEYHDQ